jgi:hypothetical protein
MTHFHPLRGLLCKFGSRVAKSLDYPMQIIGRALEKPMKLDRKLELGLTAEGSISVRALDL